MDQTRKLSGRISDFRFQFPDNGPYVFVKEAMYCLSPLVTWLGMVMGTHNNLCFLQSLYRSLLRLQRPEGREMLHLSIRTTPITWIHP